jgi:hypothetical protein
MPPRVPNFVGALKTKVSRQILNLSEIGLRKTLYNGNSPSKNAKSLSTGGTDRDNKHSSFYNLSPRKICDVRHEELKFTKLFIDGGHLKI